MFTIVLLAVLFPLSLLGLLMVAERLESGMDATTLSSKTSAR